MTIISDVSPSISKEFGEQQDKTMVEALHQKDKHIVELEQSRTNLLEEKSLISQELRYIFFTSDGLHFSDFVGSKICSF